RSVPQIVAERNRLGELFVQVQNFRDGARDLRNLERVGQPRPVVIARRSEEHLRLVLQASECLGVDDAIAVPLKRRSYIIFRLYAQPAARCTASGRLWRQNFHLALLELFSNGHNRVNSTVDVQRCPVISPKKLVPEQSGATLNSSASVWPTSANV